MNKCDITMSTGRTELNLWLYVYAYMNNRITTKLKKTTFA